MQETNLFEHLRKLFPEHLFLSTTKMCSEQRCFFLRRTCTQCCSPVRNTSVQFSSFHYTASLPQLRNAWRTKINTFPDDAPAPHHDGNEPTRRKPSRHRTTRHRPTRHTGLLVRCHLEIGHLGEGAVSSLRFRCTATLWTKALKCSPPELVLTPWSCSLRGGGGGVKSALPALVFKTRGWDQSTFPGGICGMTMQGECFLSLGFRCFRFCKHNPWPKRAMESGLGSSPVTPNKEASGYKSCGPRMIISSFGSHVFF